MSRNTCTAIVVQNRGEADAVEVNIPKLRDDYIIVKVKAVALNPTDWKHIDCEPITGARVGDSVLQIPTSQSPHLTLRLTERTDRIKEIVSRDLFMEETQVYHEDGAFAEYVTAKGDLMIKVPGNLNDEEAATLGVGIATVGQALYQSLELLLPTKPSLEKPILLIYGGSTATGSLAIQYAKLSGFLVAATCSEHNFQYLKSLGADATFNYNSPTCSNDIKTWSNDSIALAFDCISEGSSPSITASAMSSSGGIYTNILFVTPEEVHKINPKVQVKQALAYSIFDEYFTFATLEFPGKPQDLEFSKMFWEMSRGLLEQGKLRVHRTSVNKYGNGFEGILKGLDALRKGEASGEKLVFTLP
ncbi:Protein TOXD [Lachnellula willkommii]|uniref:Protein TOXD n=1 Tax=Lachnellula willkommii TaxID=215461 RepID=A0A559MH32_9HELO|nr:Protein TOXD [Lachnellula willkommii]